MDRRPLRTRRIEAGLTQDEFAALLGVDRRTIGRWENHDRTPRRRQRERIDAVLAELTLR